MRVSRALVVGAHPDDAELFAGGTIAGWVRAGVEVTILVLTDGRLGSRDPPRPPDEVVALRAGEARAAAALLGARVALGGLPDGGGEENRRTATALVARALRAARPDVLVGHDPWRAYELHPDHRTAGVAMSDGMITAREPRSSPALAGLEPHRPVELWFAGSDHPNRFVDVSETIEAKLGALARHASQFGHISGWEERVRRWNARIGAERGYRYAEAFRVLTPGMPDRPALQ